MRIVLLTGVPNSGKSVAAKLLATRKFKILRFSDGRFSLPKPISERAQQRVTEIYTQHTQFAVDNFVFEDTSHQVEIDVITSNFDDVRVVNIRPRYVGYESTVMIGEPDRPKLSFGFEVSNFGNTSTLIRQLDKVVLD